MITHSRQTDRGARRSLGPRKKTQAAVLAAATLKTSLTWFSD